MIVEDQQSERCQCKPWSHPPSSTPLSGMDWKHVDANCIGPNPNLKPYMLSDLMIAFVTACIRDPVSPDSDLSSYVSTRLREDDVAKFLVLPSVLDLREMSLGFRV